MMLSIALLSSAIGSQLIGSTIEMDEWPMPEKHMTGSMEDTKPMGDMEDKTKSKMEDEPVEETEEATIIDYV